MNDIDLKKTIIETISTFFAARNGDSNSESRLVRVDGTHPSYIAQIDASGLGGELRLELQRFVEDGLKEKGLELAVYFKQRSSSGTKVPAKRTTPPNKKALGLDRRLKPIVGVKQVIVVASGKGGVGKSTISTNLTVALSQLGYRSGLLDADIYGPSAPTMLGLNKKQLQVDAKQKLIPLESHGIFSMSFGYLSDQSSPAIWRGPMVGKSLLQLCYEVAWPELDYLVIDLPPGTGDVQLTLIENLPIALALIVTTPQEVAVIDAQKALIMFERLDIKVAGIVENMSGFACPCCGEVSDIFGREGITRLTSQHRQKILLQLPLQASIRKNCDQGTPSALEPDSHISCQFRELAKQLATP